MFSKKALFDFYSKSSVVVVVVVAVHHGNRGRPDTLFDHFACFPPRILPCSERGQLHNSSSASNHWWLTPFHDVPDISRLGCCGWKSRFKQRGSDKQRSGIDDPTTNHISAPWAGLSSYKLWLRLETVPIPSLERWLASHLSRSNKPAWELFIFCKAKPKHSAWLFLTSIVSGACPTLKCSNLESFRYKTCQHYLMQQCSTLAILFSARVMCSKKNYDLLM